MHAARDWNWQRKILTVLNIHFIIRANALIETEKVYFCVMTDGVGVLDREVLTNTKESNVRMKRTKMIVQEHWLLELGLVGRVDVDLFAKGCSQINNAVDQGIVLTDHHGLINNRLLRAAVFWILGNRYWR